MLPIQISDLLFYRCRDCGKPYTRHHTDRVPLCDTCVDRLGVPG